MKCTSSLLGVLVGGCVSVSALAANLPTKNPYLADSVYAVGHVDSAQQDSVKVAGPMDSTRALKPSEIEYTPTGPAYFGMSTSGEYLDNKRVLWGNGLDRIVKLDHETHELLTTYYLPDAEKRYTEQDADEAIAVFEADNDGISAIYAGFQQAQKLKSLTSIYTLLDHTNTYFVSDKRGFMTAYGDAKPGVRESKIEPKRTFNFPAQITGYGMGINMTYDGWLVTVTENGELLAIKPDFSEYRVGKLQHSEGAAEKKTGRTGYAWVRNGLAIDDDGSIYVASQEYMHKVKWTGDGFSTSEADGAWAVPYDNTWGHGSGATPSLMGFGEEDQFVVITDGAERMNLMLYWRDQIPADWAALPGQPRRVAGIAPVTMGEQNLQKIQSEQSVVVGGYGAIVVNNKARNIPWYMPEQAATLLISFMGSNPKHQPYGVQKFAWNPETRTLDTAWVNNSVSSPSCVPIISHGSNSVYLIGARDNKWTLEALDWDSGESSFHYVIGGQRYNPFFSGALLDEAGRIHYGGPWGRVRLNPELPKVEAPESSDAVDAVVAEPTTADVVEAIADERDPVGA